jgi:CheY-like chemotaxis protein
MVKLLVADDDPRIRRLLRLTLEPVYQVIEAADGAEALHLIAQKRPDLLILDVAMPVLDGLAVCRTVRGDPAFDRVGIIVISANASAEAVLAAGADRYVSKPFRPLQLLSTIQDVVERRGGATQHGHASLVMRPRDGR